MPNVIVFFFVMFFFEVDPRATHKMSISSTAQQKKDTKNEIKEKLAREDREKEFTVRLDPKFLACAERAGHTF